MACRPDRLARNRARSRASLLEQALSAPARRFFRRVPPAALPLSSLFLPPPAPAQRLSPTRPLPRPVPLPPRAALSLRRLLAHVLATDLPRRLPRPPPRPERAPVPVARLRSGSAPICAQPGSEPALLRAQVPQDRAPSAPPQPEPAPAAQWDGLLPAGRARDLRGAAQHPPAERASPDRTRLALRGVGRVGPDPSPGKDERGATARARRRPGPPGKTPRRLACELASHSAPRGSARERTSP